MAERSNQRPMLELLEGWLRHKSDMVNFEAARVMCEMKNVSSAQLSRPISGSCDFDRYLNRSLTLRNSPATFPLITETCPEIRGNTHTGRLGTHAPGKRFHLQCRSRRTDL